MAEKKKPTYEQARDELAKIVAKLEAQNVPYELRAGGTQIWVPQDRALRQEAFEAIALLMNPITPHLAHALWQALGHAESVVDDQPWPKADPAALVRDAVTLAVQVNGKLRGTIEVAVGLPNAEIEALALAESNVAKFLEGQTVRKVIVVPGKIVNVVAG